MKLLSLYIEEYKNIKKQTFDFSDNSGYIALIGLNGSGKSNLLEAIGLIFNGLFNNKRIPFSYEIEYEHDGKIYLRKPRISMIDGTKVKDSDMFYPSSVIACYSGEDMRLWSVAYEDYYMHYFQKAIDGEVLSPKLLYINKYCWDIALLSLLCSDDEDVKKILKGTFNIDNLENVKVKFSFGNSDSFKNHIALSWIMRIQNECLDKEGQATLKSILSYEVPLKSKQSKEKSLFHHLYLLSQPKKNKAKGNNVEKYITEINIENNGISFDNYSEGHKKLILIECITQILGDENTLILLDEPDAHVHIELKKDLLECIERFEGQTILTTHSPVFSNEIQRSHKDNLYLIRDGKQINADIVNKLTELSGGELDFIRGSVVVGSKYILVVEGISDVRCLTKAIKVWSRKDSKYRKLESVRFLSAGGTGDVKDIFTDVLFSQMDYIEKVVFLFDIDDAGKKGYNKIDKLINEKEYKQLAPKIDVIYYKDDTTKNFELEDLFPKEAYKHIVDRVHGFETYRDFKSSSKATEDIKNHIKENAFSFKDEYYDNFKEILDKLLKVFGL